jgi:hypothetical protein
MKEIINHTAHGGWFRLNPNVYWIEILKDYFDKKNLEDFKRFCKILLNLWDFKRIF